MHVFAIYKRNLKNNPFTCLGFDLIKIIRLGLSFVRTGKRSLVMVILNKFVGLGDSEFQSLKMNFEGFSKDDSIKANIDLKIQKNCIYRDMKYTIRYNN